MKRKKLSLKYGSMTMIVLCWLIPVLIVMSLAGFLLGRSYEQSAEQEVNDRAEYAIRQVQLQLENAIHDSKGVSYDGVIRNAYRQYQAQGDPVELYRSANTYLTQMFSRIPQYKAVFLSFWDPGISSDIYILNGSERGFELLSRCKQDAPRIQARMAEEETAIRFLMLDEQLYLVRNLLDSQFEPYASLVMMLDPQVIFESVNGLPRVEQSMLELDGSSFCLCWDGPSGLQPAPENAVCDVSYGAAIGSHSVRFSAKLSEYHVFEENPWIIGVGIAVSMMVIPLHLIVISLFRRHVTRPMETLVEAHQHVQAGNRGYVIEGESPNLEFEKLYSHFNAMSTELQNQFERSYLEQQASQKAQIKALQSQINPHFLNNTLEVINWEARLAGNDRVSAMIEALSTMLGAALDRKGRSEIPLREELSYVDAYLYIIHQRIGEKFLVHKEIDESCLEQMVPRLILQPIAENAVEHDIAPRHGGNLWVRAHRSGTDMVLEVEHDGSLTEADREKVRILLAEDGQAQRVGLHNVSQRLRLIYGSRASLQILETDHETVLARICFPADLCCETKERNLP